MKRKRRENGQLIMNFDRHDNKSKLETGTHIKVDENQTGISYHNLFANYLRGAKKIHVIDAYMRTFWQIRNMVEFLCMIYNLMQDGERVDVSLLTASYEKIDNQQDEYLEKTKRAFVETGMRFTYDYGDKKEIHARSITTNTGWKISLDRGLDIFQRCDRGYFSLGLYSQESRACKAFEVTYIKTS